MAALKLSLFLIVGDYLLTLVVVTDDIQWESRLLQGFNQELKIPRLLRVLLRVFIASTSECALFCESGLPALMADDVLAATYLNRLPLLQVQVLFA